MMAMPAPIISSPVTTLARRTRASMPVVSAVAIPWKMNTAPMKVASSRIVQSMLKIRKPTTTSTTPLMRSSPPVTGQFLRCGPAEPAAERGAGSDKHGVLLGTGGYGFPDRTLIARAANRARGVPGLLPGEPLYKLVSACRRALTAGELK